MMGEGIFEVITNLKNRCLDREERIQKEYLLSPAEYNGLLSVEPGGIYSCNELSKKLGLSVSRSSRVLERLINNGYFKGVKFKEDRRVLKVTLTEKGKTIRNKIYGKLEECEKEIVNSLQKSELYLLENTLNKLSRIFISQ
jgi:DNA-binding MarR family transcriptional regulator